MLISQWYPSIIGGEVFLENASKDQILALCLVTRSLCIFFFFFYPTFFSIKLTALFITAGVISDKVYLNLENWQVL